MWESLFPEAKGMVPRLGLFEESSRDNFPLDPTMALSPDCEAPLKKEGGLPEGPVLEALLCAETGEKKIELKEEETIMDCQVGPPLRPQLPSHPRPPAPAHLGPALQSPLAP